MSFAHQYLALAAAAAAVLLPLLYYLAGRGRSRRLARFISAALIESLAGSTSTVRRVTKAALASAALVLLLLALARPQWGHEWVEKKGRGIDITICMDTSRSMLARDVSPGRLERAKLQVLDLVDRLQGDRVGLVAFAGRAFLQCPLTLDYDVFRQTLETLDTEIIPYPGTDIAAAINEAVASFPDNENVKVVVLITDGEDLEERGVERAREAGENNVKIYTVGVGKASGVAIPDPDNPGADLVGPDGEVVRTRLDVATLEDIARATGAFYTPLGATGSGLERVYEDSLGYLPAEEREARLQKIALERYQLPLGLAIALLLLEALIGTRRRTPRAAAAVLPAPSPSPPPSPAPARPPSPPRGAAAALALAAALLLLPAIRPPAHAGVGEAAGEAARRYRAGDFEEAANRFREVLADAPRNPHLRFNLGSSLYRQGQFQPAAAAFADALGQSVGAGDLALQEKALYNLGNANYRLGQKVLAVAAEEGGGDVSDTVEHWEEAVRNYAAALALNPVNKRARYNKELVEKKLAELKEQQAPPQQSQPQSGGDGEEEKEKKGEPQEGEPQDGQGGGGGQKSGEKSGSEPSGGGSGDGDSERREGGEQGGESEAAEPDPSAASKEGGNDTSSDGDKEGEGREPREVEGEEEKGAAGGGAADDPEGEARAAGEKGDASIVVMMTPEQALNLLRELRAREKKLPAAIQVRPEEGRAADPAERKTW